MGSFSVGKTASWPSTVVQIPARAPNAPMDARPSKMAPDAFVASRVAGYSPLQKHVAFFDQNGDHRITRAETRQGLEDMGVSKVKSALAAIAINAGLATLTQGHPSMTVNVDNIKAAKHESDTGAFDKNGHFNPAALDAMFAKYDTTHSGTLSQSEIDTMVAANKTDTLGHIAALGEFGLLMQMGADTTKVVNGKEEPAISRAALQSFYDGTLFYRIAEKNGHPHTMPE